MPDQPVFISVIVAVFNGSNTLQQCIDSFEGQTYQNKELIIIDGGSDDGTVDLLKANSNKISFWSSKSDKGIYSAWNKGLNHSNGNWICFLGADDYFWDNEVLKKISVNLNRLPRSINVAYGKVMLVSKLDKPLYIVGKPWEKVKHHFTKFMSIPHPGLMHRKNLFKENGNFDESFKIAGDYELLLREFKKREAVFMSIIIAGVRQGGISCNSGHSLKLLQEVRRAQWKNGFYMPSFFWIFGVIRLFIRKIIWAAVGERIARKWLDFLRRLNGLPDYWTKI
jgi:glycosyltransferase involved in cell wall biosynthesis